MTIRIGPRGRVLAEFAPSQQAPHLRCPGSVFSHNSAVASGTACIDALARHGGTIRLATGTKLNDDGYTGHTTSNLALTVSRPKLRIINDALPSGAPG